MDDTKSKTNESWYPYKELGSFFKLENGILMGCPMNTDGTRDETPFEVDWDRGVEEKDKEVMNKIVEELQSKN